MGEYIRLGRERREIIIIKIKPTTPTSTSWTHCIQTTNTNLNLQLKLHQPRKMSITDHHPRVLSLSSPIPSSNPSSSTTPSQTTSSTPQTQSRRPSHESAHDAHHFLSAQEKTHRTLNGSIKKMWEGIKQHAVEHHRSVNAAYQAQYGAGARRVQGGESAAASRMNSVV